MEVTDTPVGGFIQYACPGGNVTDNSRYVAVACQQNSSDPTGGGAYLLPTTWPACRLPFTCLPRFLTFAPPACEQITYIKGL